MECIWFELKRRRNSKIKCEFIRQSREDRKLQPSPPSCVRKYLTYLQKNRHAKAKKASASDISDTELSRRDGVHPEINHLFGDLEMENAEKKQGKAAAGSVVTETSAEKSDGKKGGGGGALQQVKEDIVHSLARGEVVHCSPKKDGERTVWQLAVLIEEPVQDYQTRTWRIEKQLHTMVSTVQVALGTHTLVRKSGVSLYKKPDGTLTKGDFKDKIVGVL